VISLSRFLWRFREVVNFEHFTLAYQSVEPHEYPLLTSFLKEESRLGIIKYTADILAWHKILFEIFPPGVLTRDEAASITNREAIEKLPAHRRADANRVLDRYCIAFNTALPLVDRIFECEPNPFITGEGGVVDLSGAKRPDGTKMSAGVSINFSLPSMVQGANDSMGLCTIKLLQLMQNSQGEVLESLFTPPARKPARSGILPVAAAAAADTSEQLKQIPGLSYLTAPLILQQQLIVYDREEHLHPLLRNFAVQGLKYGDGANLEYDFLGIQQSLANMLLSGKTPVKLQVSHYQYRGDVKNQGHLSGLNQRIAQESLPPSILDMIWTEIDTSDRLTKLMAQLEMVISFLVSISIRSVALSAQTSLQKFVLESLLVDPQVWAEMTTHTITQQVMLCHIQSLFMSLEEKMFGNPLDGVAQSYRENLSDQLLNDLRKSAKHLNLTELIPVMRDFMIQQLCETKWPTDANLKEYLTYVATDVLIEEQDWYEHFPEALQLQHTYQTFTFLSSLIN
jgi:hypothetical protein